MKKIALLLITLLTTFLSQAQDVQSFVNHQLQTYPKSRLLDLYKSCFQDFMGAEHLVSDKQRVKAYLDDELKQSRSLSYQRIYCWMPLSVVPIPPGVHLWMNGTNAGTR